MDYQICLNLRMNSHCRFQNWINMRKTNRMICINSINYREMDAEDV